MKRENKSTPNDNQIGPKAQPITNWADCFFLELF